MSPRALFASIDPTGVRHVDHLIVRGNAFDFEIGLRLRWFGVTSFVVLVKRIAAADKDSAGAHGEKLRIGFSWYLWGDYLDLGSVSQPPTETSNRFPSGSLPRVSAHLAPLTAGAPSG